MSDDSDTQKALLEASVHLYENDVETLRGTLEAAEADCAELRAGIERLRGQVSECAALLAERTAQRDGYRAAASEWERLRNEAYRQFREASDERDFWNRKWLNTASPGTPVRCGACICPCHDKPHGPCRCSCGS